MHMERNDHGDFEQSTTVGTLREGLLASPTEWSSGAKGYLQGSPEIIDLVVVDEYSDMVRELYRWFFAQFEILHGAEVEAVNRLVKRRIQLLTGFEPA